MAGIVSGHRLVGLALERPQPLIYFGGMNIKLPREQSDWLETQVAAGHFASVDDAVALAVADFMAIGDDDLTWARPYVDEARAAASRGEVVSVDDATDDIESSVKNCQGPDLGSETAPKWQLSLPGSVGAEGDSLQI